MMAPVSIELEVLFADLRLCLAQRRVQRALEEMVRKYRPDQPRAPKGTPEGGQWVVEPNSARQRRLADERARLAELTPFGTLVLEWRLNDGSRMCIYDYGSQKWILPREPTLQIGCIYMLHQSAVFPFGTRLNDN
jgi:hypothetical protein